GMGAIQSAGGITIAQSPDTCVVDSMPRSAIERGFAGRVVSLSSLSSVLQAKCAPQRRPADPGAEYSTAETVPGEPGLRRRSS
ncbi:MAG: chemotaxis protein CheB, partial [Candidatus Acidiferrales bacterium]